MFVCVHVCMCKFHNLVRWIMVYVYVKLLVVRMEISVCVVEPLK